MKSVAGWGLRVAAGIVIGGLLLTAAPAAEGDKSPPSYEKGKTATSDKLTFKVAVLPADPFSEANRVGATPTVRRGEVFSLLITGIPKEGYHTYPLTIPAAEKENKDLHQPALTQIVLGSDAFRPLVPVQESPPTLHKDERLNQSYLVHEKRFQWMQDVLVKPDTNPGKHTLTVKLKNFQVCDEKGCTQDKKRGFEIPITITSQPALPLSKEIEQRVHDAEAAAAREAAGPGGVAAGDVGGDSKKGLLALIVTSILAAAAMLFTPCVFPMIPITVSFFLKQSERESYNPLMTALIYTATIIVVLVLAVLVLGQLIVTWANSIWLNLGLGALLIVFALSLFGMYELELPHFLTRFTSAHEGQGGYGGAFFMALTFTITSFTCTGPFLGPLLVATSELKLSFAERLAGATAYSATFAAPFFLLALFPAVLRSLPKSGGWLNVVKVVMGFLELGMALKFLGNVDINLNPGDPVLFTYEAIFAIWIALAIGCGLYLLGLFRLPHDTPVEHLSVGRFLMATVFLALGVYMAPALWHKTPQGVLGRFLVSFAPLGQGQETWELDYATARERALKENKPLFIDFTGVNCTNCRANEVGPFQRPEVKELLSQFVVVQLYNDSVPRPGLSREEADREAERNAAWQQATFNSSTTPQYVVFRPDPSVIEEDGKLKGEVLGTAEGYISDVPAFVNMLKKALGR